MSLGKRGIESLQFGDAAFLREKTFPERGFTSPDASDGTESGNNCATAHRFGCLVLWGKFIIGFRFRGEVSYDAKSGQPHRK